MQSVSSHIHFKEYSARMQCCATGLPHISHQPGTMLAFAGETSTAVAAEAMQLDLRTEDPATFDRLTRAREELCEGAGAYEVEAAPACAQPGADRDQLEVVFLGTGAAIPSKYRNVTAVSAALPLMQN